MAKKAKIVLLLQMGFLMVSGLLQDAGMPYPFVYLADVSNVFLLLCVLKVRDWKRMKQAKTVWIAIIVWLGYMLTTSAVNGVPFRLVLWAMRKWCRCFVLFAACLTFLEKDDVLRLVRLTFVLYVIHTGMVVIQSVQTALQGGFKILAAGDHLNGLFGHVIGGNGWCNVFTCTVLTAVMCRDYERGTLSWQCAFVMLSAMGMAGVQELKVFFYEFIAINAAVPIAFAVCGQLKKTVLWKMLLCAAVSYGIGLVFLAVIYPTHFWVVIGKRSVEIYEEKTRVHYPISRVHFMKEINNLFSLNWRQQLCGFGFGNCEHSRISIFQSSFAEQYGDLRYYYFAHQTLYLEGGLMGLILYMFIPLSTAAEQGLAILKGKSMLGLRVFGCIFAGLTAVNILYNNAMYTELSFLNMFILAMFYILLSSGADRGGECE